MEEKVLGDVELLSSYCVNVSATGGGAAPPTNPTVFWMEGVVLTATAVIGIVGNSVTALVLNRISLNNVFNQLIVMLCIFDSLFAGVSLLEYGLKKGFGLITYTTPVYVNLWPKLVYPLHNVTYSLSLFVTLAIAIERYMAICHPFLVHEERCSVRTGPTMAVNGGQGGQHIITSSSAHPHPSTLKKRTCHYMLPVILISIVINIPKFFEFRTVTNENKTYIEPTEMRMDPNYQLYYINWIRAILTAFIPFLLLAILNGKIIFQMHKAEKIWSARASSSHKREAKLARILVLIVFFFLFCNMGKLALNLYDLGSLSHLRACQRAGLQFKSPEWVIALISVNHVFLVMNASANLFLFAVIGTQFRTTLLAMLRLRRQPTSPVTPQRNNHTRRSVDSSLHFRSTLYDGNAESVSEAARRHKLVPSQVRMQKDEPVVEIALSTIVNGNEASRSRSGSSIC